MEFEKINENEVKITRTTEETLDQSSLLAKKKELILAKTTVEEELAYITADATSKIANIDERIVEVDAALAALA